MATTEQSIEYQLNKITAVNIQYEKIAKLTGENFNIFSILELDYSELIHSKFITELLNPYGSHEQGSIFLELFIKHILTEEEQIKFKDFDAKTATVTVEKYAGLINKDYTKGGRIDIFIGNKNRMGILIENKIYAEDQKNQLFRYSRFGKDYFQEGSHILLYLTLDGNEPSIHSTNGQLISNQDYKLVSYYPQLQEWLKLCLKETSNHPILRETIIQYTNLIKKLTNQSINDNMEQEIEGILLQNLESFKAAEISSNVFNTIRNKIHDCLVEELRTLNTIPGQYIDPLSWRGFDIHVWFDADSAGIFYGFCAYKDNESVNCRQRALRPLADIIISLKLNPEFGKEATESYLYWIFPDKKRWFYKFDIETLFRLKEKDFRKSFIDEIIEEAKEKMQIVKLQLQ